MLVSHRTTSPNYTEHFSSAELMKLDFLVSFKKRRGKVKKGSLNKSTIVIVLLPHGQPAHFSNWDFAI